tara:strand:- start:40121 stop:41047 length:927 start_codon:yes stop_codon:yes gene_type:complete
MAILMVLIFGVAFFFWASSSNIKGKETAKLITNTFEQHTNNDSIYSVVTYNIRHMGGKSETTNKPKSLFDENLKIVQDAFKDLNADILCFQEIDYAAKRSYKINQQNEIAKLGYNYVAQAINRDQKYVPFPLGLPSKNLGNLLSGQSILSKYPLKEHQRIVLEPLENMPFYKRAFHIKRLAQIATVTINNSDIILINVHLENTDKKTRTNQLKSVIDLFNKYKKEYPVILLGDFNSRPTADEEISKLFDMEAVGNNNFGITSGAKEDLKKVDFLFYTSTSIEMITSTVLTQFENISGHLPIELRFKLK